MPRFLILLASLALLPLGPASAEDAHPIGILLAAGDIAKCSAEGKDEETAALIGKQIAEAETAKIPIRVLALGDLAYDNGTKKDFGCFDASWGKFKTYLMPVPGNHDYVSQSGQEYFAYFHDFFAGVSGPDGYYSVMFPDATTGPWQLIGLNAYAGIKKKSVQIKWLKEVLAKSQPPCVLAFAHPFLRSSGFHGHQSKSSASAPLAPEDLMATPFKTLDEYGASVLLSGHDHDFEQFARMDVDGRASSDGLRSFVIGTGGAPLYNKTAYSSKAPGSEFYDQDNIGLLRIELFADHYTWHFVPITGEGVATTPAFDTCATRRQP